MKFWEWWIFTTGLLCIFSADSSIGWCAILAIFCLFGIIMRQFMDDVAAATRRSRAQKSTTPMAVESDAWIGHCKSDHVPDNNITIWDEWQ